MRQCVNAPTRQCVITALASCAPVCSTRACHDETAACIIARRSASCSVPATHPVRHMLMRQPVVHHAFAVVFTPVRSRFKNRQCEEHEQAYCESDQTRDRFSVHDNLL
ncbi:hypothetical protein Bxe_A1290 [Paraburkholderia xenovorans LB400]|uniref:Lipoprotein n=1 Tax=Paraburkholderia xenovorans (strain LB400) TaxID=266265 RepID=Q13W76_PARXL|nr:hypothetical protein Bxe_A1290 [Paraburkholderia xenovorans LB400]